MKAEMFKSKGAIAIYALLAIGILCLIGYNNWGWFGGSKTKWDEQCRKSGGVVKTSGEVCDYLNCDKSKYSCSMYS